MSLPTLIRSFRPGLFIPRAPQSMLLLISRPALDLRLGDTSSNVNQTCRAPLRPPSASPLLLSAQRHLSTTTLNPPNGHSVSGSVPYSEKIGRLMSRLPSAEFDFWLGPEGDSWRAAAMNYHSIEVLMTLLGLRACTLFYNYETDEERIDFFVQSTLIPLCKELGIDQDGIMFRKVVEDFLSNTGEDFAGRWVLVNTNHVQWDLVNRFFFTPGHPPRLYTDTTSALGYPITDFEDAYLSWTTTFIYKDVKATQKLLPKIPMKPGTENEYCVPAHDYSGPPGLQQETRSRAEFERVRDAVAPYGFELELLIRHEQVSEPDDHHYYQEMRGGNYRSF